MATLGIIFRTTGHLALPSGFQGCGRQGREVGARRANTDHQRRPISIATELRDAPDQLLHVFRGLILAQKSAGQPQQVVADAARQPGNLALEPLRSRKQLRAS